MGAAYSFVTTWQVPASADRSWTEIERALRPGAVATWWPSVQVVDPPSALAPGERMTLAVRSPIGYRLRVRLTLTEVEPGRSITAVSTGDLRGSGRIDVQEAGETASIIVFRWDVATERGWMNASAFALRPAFERAHAQVMREGERGLRAAFGA